MFYFYYIFVISVLCLAHLFILNNVYNFDLKALTWEIIEMTRFRFWVKYMSRLSQKSLKMKNDNGTMFMSGTKQSSAWSSIWWSKISNDCLLYYFVCIDSIRLSHSKDTNRKKSTAEQDVIKVNIELSKWKRWRAMWLAYWLLQGV